MDVVTSKHYSLVYFSPDMFSLSIRISHNPIKGKTVFWQYKDIIRIGHATILQELLDHHKDKNLPTGTGNSVITRN